MNIDELLKTFSDQMVKVAEAIVGAAKFDRSFGGYVKSIQKNDSGDYIAKVSYPSKDGDINVNLGSSPTVKAGDPVKITFPQNDPHNPYIQSVSGSFVGGNGSEWNEVNNEKIEKLKNTVDFDKKNIFTTKPTVPYSEGDLWVDASTGLMFYCVASRHLGEFQNADWDYASKYMEEDYLNDAFMNFVKNDGIGEQIDNKSEIWTGHIPPLPNKPLESEEDFATTNINYPADGWYTQADKEMHVNDLYIYKAQSGDDCYFYKWNGTYWERAKDMDITQLETNFDDYVDAVDADISAIQSQLDGSITNWFYSVAPTLTNEPAKNWTTNALKEEHVGDIYYNDITNKAYKFTKHTDGTFSWVETQSTSVLVAMSKAANAQDTADNKRRVFYNQPTAPYDVGDLWVQGANGDIMRCKTAKASGSYSASDWELASKYTDDALAQEAKDLAESAVGEVDVQYYLSTSNVLPTGGSWSTTAPAWVDGKYMWSRTKKAFLDGTIEYMPSENGTCIAGATGASGTNGSNGVGISSIVEKYYKSTSATSLTGGSWADAAPQWENGKYIWTKSIITYTNGSTKETDAICVTGAKGENGKSVGSVKNYYLATSASSGVTTSTAGWTENVQNITATNKYLWNYEQTKYSDGTTASTTTPCVIGVYGEKGNTGVGIKSITEHYQVSSSNSTAPSSWQSTPPATSTTNKYLWNYETITYTDNSTSDSTKRIIGTHGETGAKGDTGATGPQGDKGYSGNIIELTLNNMTTMLQNNFHNLHSGGTDDNGVECVQGTATDRYLMFTGYKDMNFNGGDKVYYKLNIPNWGGTSISGYVRIWFYNSSKQYVSATSANTHTLYAGSWNKISGTLTIPSSGLGGARYYIFGIEKSAYTVPIGMTVGSYAEKMDSYAAKYATNYMDYKDGTGLIVGDMTTGTLTGNTLIDANGMAVRSGNTELARFGASTIELGKNNANSTISMKNGSFQIKSMGTTNPDTGLELFNPYTQLYSPNTDMAITMSNDYNSQTNCTSNIVLSSWMSRWVNRNSLILRARSKNTGVTSVKNESYGYIEIQSDSPISGLAEPEEAESLISMSADRYWIENPFMFQRALRYGGTIYTDKPITIPLELSGLYFLSTMATTNSSGATYGYWVQGLFVSVYGNISHYDDHKSTNVGVSVTYTNDRTSPSVTLTNSSTARTVIYNIFRLG